MFFTVAVDLPEGGFFEYSTESILQLLQAVQAFGNTDIEEVEEFAESIVRECIDIISLYTVRMDRHGEEYLQVINEIKKHFGISFKNFIKLIFTQCLELKFSIHSGISMLISLTGNSLRILWNILAISSSFIFRTSIT